MEHAEFSGWYEQVIHAGVRVLLMKALREVGVVVLPLERIPMARLVIMCRAVGAPVDDVARRWVMNAIVGYFKGLSCSTGKHLTYRESVLMEIQAQATLKIFHQKMGV